MAAIEDLRTAPDGKQRPRHSTGMRYRVRWTLPGGAERSRSFPDGKKTVATQLKTTVEADLLHGTYTDPQAGRITLREYVTSEWLPHQNYSRTTAEAVERRCACTSSRSSATRCCRPITPTVVKGWLGQLDAAPGTVRVLVALLSSILSSAIDDGVIVRNPLRTAR